MRTTHDTTVAELLELTAPPRMDVSTGVQLVGLGDNRYALMIQGKDADALTRALLERVEDIHATSLANMAAPGQA